MTMSEGLQLWTEPDYLFLFQVFMLSKAPAASHPTRQTDQSAAATSEVSLGDGSWFVEADGVRTDLNY